MAVQKSISSVESSGCESERKFIYADEKPILCETCASIVKSKGLCAECNVFQYFGDYDVVVHCDEVEEEMISGLEFDSAKANALESIVNELIRDASRKNNLNTDKLKEFLERFAQDCANEVEHRKRGGK